MTVRVTDEIHEGIYNGEPYREHERYVAGDRNWASVNDDCIFLTCGGMPEIGLDWERVADLHEVLGATLELRDKYGL